MDFDASVPNAARVYDFFLGGKDNYAADRELAQKILAILPDAADVCRGNRNFLQRAVRFLADEAGLRQFLDIGTGLPTTATSTRSPRKPHRTPGLPTSTMIRSSWPMPGLSSPTTWMSSRSRATSARRKPS